MGKKLKKFMKVVTFIISIGGILYIARDQIKAIIDKLKELKDQEKDEDLDDWDPDEFDDDDIFPDSAEDSRDYFSIHITDEEAETKDETSEEETSSEDESSEDDKTSESTEEDDKE
ncbi:DNA-directed RNA polymerase subunit delta [Anaerostipes sp.]|uniref:DNA-directed RNA polymerase subunit delta n=1 Tax=Anaerostipes sp. TaxID=1872530 RepID=UPI0025C56D1D|nr:DNA-directed RNA polymerase subunit delta [Anaerostipes sp.]